MLTIEEKRKIKDILGEGLGINPNINFPYFLQQIDATKIKVDELESKINQLLYAQHELSRKMDTIINLLYSKK